jgi:Fur family transcriptional regulator, ferric uptake regulator
VHATILARRRARRSPSDYAAEVTTSPDVDQVLREGGHRVTRPRQAVWRALTEATEHLTAEQLAARVQERDPAINLASVYRSLTLFEELELVRQSHMGDEAAGRWEVAHPDEHFHLVCRSCDSIGHHEGTLVQSVRDHLAGDHGFQAESVELIVTGRCASCAT